MNVRLVGGPHGGHEMDVNSSVLRLVFPYESPLMKMPSRGDFVDGPKVWERKKVHEYVRSAGGPEATFEYQGVR